MNQNRAIPLDTADVLAAADSYFGIVQHYSGPLWIDDAQCSIEGGMSGSPILNEDGLAIGVVCTSSGGPNLENHTAGGPNPCLTHHLPGWVLRALG